MGLDRDEYGCHESLYRIDRMQKFSARHPVLAKVKFHHRVKTMILKIAWLMLSHLPNAPAHVVTHGDVNCRKLCEAVPSCKADPHHHGSYCKHWQATPVCFGFYFTDRSRRNVCFAPNDSHCPQNRPVRCFDRPRPSERSTTFRSTFRSSSTTTTSTTTTSTTSTTTTVPTTSTTTTTLTTTVIALACANPTVTVGPGGNFPTIQAALLSSTVVNGDTILVFNGVYTEAASILVTKSVTICGQTRDGTIVTTAGTPTDPRTVFAVSVDNVVIARMTIRQLSTEGSSVGTAVSVSGPGFPQTRVNGFLLDNVVVDYTEIGVSLRASNFVIQDSILNYVGPVAPRGFGIIMYGINGNSIINNVLFGNAPLQPNLRATYITSSTGSNPNENNAGTLTLSNNQQSSVLGEFFVQDNFQGAFGALTLRFLNNIISETSTWAASFSVTSLAGNLYAQIVLQNNRASGAGTKGLFAIDGFGSGLTFRSTPLAVSSSGNVILSPVILPPFVEAPGSTGGIVGCNGAVFIVSSCTVILTP